jgi:hypothetical protein
MRVYLAGPMTGVKAHNFPLFNLVANRLRDQGCEVYNPADLTTDRWGTLAAFEALSVGEKREAVRWLLSKELAWICLHAECVYFLPGWENSYGARAEHAAATALKIEIRMVPEEMLT